MSWFYNSCLVKEGSLLEQSTISHQQHLFWQSENCNSVEIHNKGSFHQKRRCEVIWPIHISCWNKSTAYATLQCCSELLMCNIMYRLTVIDIHSSQHTQTDTNKAHRTIFNLLFSFMLSREATKPLSIRLYAEALAVMQDGGILMKRASDISTPLWKEHSFKHPF